MSIILGVQNIVGGWRMVSFYRAWKTHWAESDLQSAKEGGYWLCSNVVWFCFTGNSHEVKNPRHRGSWTFYWDSAVVGFSCQRVCKTHFLCWSCKMTFTQTGKYVGIAWRVLTVQCGVLWLAISKLSLLNVFCYTDNVLKLHVINQICCLVTRYVVILQTRENCGRLSYQTVSRKCLCKCKSYVSSS